MYAYTLPFPAYTLLLPAFTIPLPLPTHAMDVKQHGATIPCLLWWLPEVGEPPNGDYQPEQGTLGTRPTNQQDERQKSTGNINQIVIIQNVIVPEISWSFYTLNIAH